MDARSAMRMLPHSIASAIQQDAAVARPVYISSFLSRRQKGQCSYPTGTLLIECNQYILVILSAGPFFYLLAQKLISQVTFV